jgi:hypothetical protein
MMASKPKLQPASDLERWTARTRLHVIQSHSHRVEFLLTSTIKLSERLKDTTICQKDDKVAVEALSQRINQAMAIQ